MASRDPRRLEPGQEALLFGTERTRRVMVGTQELFSPRAFAFLGEARRIGDLPYPLPVRSHGATEEERRMLRQRTHAELRARGIRDRHGRLEPHVEEWLSLLARPT